MTASSSSAPRTALITGASLGIGLDFARLFAADKINLILVARSADKLEVLAKELRTAHQVQVTVIPADLTEMHAAAKLHAKVVSLGLSVDYLVNNAGFGQYGPYLSLDAQEEARMLQLNIIALTELTRVFAQDMAKRRFGGILNVASTAAFQPGPLMAGYYASKAYVLSYSEALANELKDVGISVTAVCPGPTRSGFQEAAKMEGSRMLQMGMMDSATVAAQGYRAFHRKQPVIITGLTNNLLAQSIRLTPRCLVTKISRAIASRKGA